MLKGGDKKENPAAFVNVAGFVVFGEVPGGFEPPCTVLQTGD